MRRLDLTMSQPQWSPASRAVECLDILYRHLHHELYTNPYNLILNERIIVSMKEVRKALAESERTTKEKKKGHKQKNRAESNEEEKEDDLSIEFRDQFYSLLR